MDYSIYKIVGNKISLTMRVITADTLTYAKRHMTRVNTMEIGIERLGFLASSPDVAMTSNPTKA